MKPGALAACTRRWGALALAWGGVLAGCSSPPLVPFSTEAPPMVLAMAAQTGLQDHRGRFREIFCAVLQARAGEVPDHRPCEDALTRVGTEPAATGRPVALGASSRRLLAAVVPGLGFDCIQNWLQATGETARHVGRFGFEQRLIQVDALSGIERNARRIRDEVMALAPAPGPGTRRIVLIGYSKGAPDVLEALVRYPEIRPRLAAVVSMAGAVGGSPLANEATQYQADLFQHFPGADCDGGDGGAVHSLRTDVRQAWLAANPLPGEVPMYSVVALPRPERLSTVLRLTGRRLGQIDGRHDGQMLAQDEVIPGSGLLAYVNADHWAVVLPIARSHRTVASLWIDQNAYPREALVEALLRFIEEDLADRGR